MEIAIRAPLDELWRLTQSPDLHQRWDLRFTRIDYLPRPDPDPAPALPLRDPHRLRPGVPGEGESVGERDWPTGRAAPPSLQFRGPEVPDRRRPGYWKYVPDRGRSGSSRATTTSPASGRPVALDALVFRPLLGWATAWSFDRLRLWLEQGLEPGRVRQALIHAAARTGLRPCGSTRAWSRSFSRPSGASSPCWSRPASSGDTSARRSRSWASPRSASGSCCSRGRVALAVRRDPARPAGVRGRRARRRAGELPRAVQPPDAHPGDGGARVDRLVGVKDVLSARHCRRRPGSGALSSIYRRALGPAFDRLHPQVQRRFGFGSADGVASIGTGRMEEVWRGPAYTLPFLAVGAWRHIMFPRPAGTCRSASRTTPTWTGSAGRP